MTETVFRNATLVLADETVRGSLLIRDGMIAEAGGTGGSGGEDLEGDFLLPGLVELHTDQLENHYRPRPGVFWNPLAALHAHDAQIVASGITTVFDAVRIGSDHDIVDMAPHARKLLDAIETGRRQGWLRAEHLIHLRCELPSHDVVAHFEEFAPGPGVQLASLMDHTPGQRQFRSLEAYRRFYKGGRTEAELEQFIADRLTEHARHAPPNRQRIVALGHQLGLTLASHDDATLAQIEDGRRDGVRIAEFPTTLEAARAAHEAGQSILMGAPNVVRGGSHSGNMAATELVKEGLLDVLSSDYVPFALLQAAFLLPELVEGFSLAAALRLVTLNPAQAAGLDDRGELAAGKRADLVRVRMVDGMPVVRAVWRGGERVS